MSKKRYVVELSADERKRLEELTRKGKSPAKKQLKARILLQADESPLGPKWNDPKISEALGTYPMMCARVRQQFAQGGMDAVLNRATRDAARSAHLRRRERGPAHCLGLLTTSRRPREMDAALAGKQSRRIEHRGSRERQYDWARSKKNELKPHLVQQWVIPPQASSAFVAAMEDILAVYKRPHDGECPLVCLDETSKQLLATDGRRSR